jgi:hypothetical protein
MIDSADTSNWTIDHAVTARSSEPAPLTSGQPPLPVEALQDLLGGLVREREQLRERGAAPGDLEQNRRKIVRAQWQLSHAFIARYLPLSPQT